MLNWVRGVIHNVDTEAVASGMDQEERLETRRKDQRSRSYSFHKPKSRALEHPARDIGRRRRSHPHSWRHAPGYDRGVHALIKRMHSGITSRAPSRPTSECGSRGRPNCSDKPKSLLCQRCLVDVGLINPPRTGIGLGRCGRGAQANRVSAVPGSELWGVRRRGTVESFIIP